MKCEFDPRTAQGPIGMFHCPDCGEMVLAGCEHLDWDNVVFLTVICYYKVRPRNQGE